MSTPCRSCGEEIVFVKTAAGKKMPIDADTWTEGEEYFEPRVHRSHFATCPQAEQFRKKQSSAQAPGPGPGAERRGQ